MCKIQSVSEMVQTRAMYASSVKIATFQVPGIASAIASNLTDVKDLIGLHLLVNDRRFHDEVNKFIEEHRYEYNRKLIGKRITDNIMTLIAKNKTVKTMIESAMCILDLYDYLYENISDFCNNVTRDSENIRTILKLMDLKARDLIDRVDNDNFNFDMEFRFYFKQRMDLCIGRIREFL